MNARSEISEFIAHQFVGLPRDFNQIIIIVMLHPDVKPCHDRVHSYMNHGIILSSVYSMLIICNREPKTMDEILHIRHITSV